MEDSDDIIDELNWCAEDFPLTETKPKRNMRSHRRHKHSKSSDVKGTVKSERVEKNSIQSKDFIKFYEPPVGSTEIPLSIKITESSANNSSLLSERLGLLEERDKLIRSNMGKPSMLKGALSTKGTCPDMCPEKERIMRELKKLVHPYECCQNANQMDPQLAVKEYSRSSADQEEPLPHDLRPEPVLTMTMSYLINNIMCRIDDNEENLSGWYDFCWDRLRAIRKDIVQQQLCDLETVKIVEQCARFHITCFDHFWGVDITMFDEKINTENLMNCLKILMNMYEDLRKHGISCANEPEFNAYMILLKLNSGDLLWEFLNFPLSLQQAPEVIEAVKIHTSFNNNVYSQFFKSVTQTTYLNACLMQRFFNQIRVGALEAIVSAYCPPGKVSKVSLNHLVKSLKFDNEEDAISFCEACGLSLIDISELKISRNKFKRPDTSFKIITPSWLVQQKRISFPLAVVGPPFDLPLLSEHTVHNSFIDDKTLHPDALDASDQEEKMLRDDIKRKLLLKASKNIQGVRTENTCLNTLNKPNSRPQSLSRASSVSESVSGVDAVEEHSMRSSYTPEPVELESEESDEYDDDIVPEDEEKEIISPVKENIPVKEIQQESSLVDTVDASFTLKPVIDLNLKPFQMSSPDVPSVRSELFKIPLTPSAVSFSPKRELVEKKTLNDVKKFKFDSASFLTPPKSPTFKIDSPFIQPPAKSPELSPKILDETSQRDLILEKIKSNLTENLKKVSARKIGRLWREKVRAIKKSSAFTPVIHHMNVHDYLTIWGQAHPKQNNIFSRIKSTKKLSSTVNSLLETDVFDTSHPIVKQIGYKIGETLGHRSLQHALKYGNVSQPSPVYWKLVMSIPTVKNVKSNLLARLKLWCSEAFFSGKKTQVGNVQVMMTSSGVAAYTKVEVIESLELLDLAQNLSACAFINIPGWESPSETQERLMKIISFKNHPIPVLVLHLSPSPVTILPIKDEGILYQSEILLKSPKVLFESMSQLARNSFFFTCKTEPLYFLLEWTTEKFLDTLHESSYNHDGLYNVLASPNNIIFLYNSFIDKLKTELVKCYKTNIFGTTEEIRSSFEKNHFEKKTSGDKVTEINNFMSKLKLGFLIWPPNSSHEILKIFRNYCFDAKIPQVVSTVIRMINPPDDDDTEIVNLRSYLLELPWLRIIEVILKEFIRCNHTSIHICYCEKTVKELVSSHWWMQTDLVLKYKPPIETDIF